MSTDSPVTFGEAFRKARRSAPERVTMGDVALFLNKSVTVISDVENDKARLSIRDILSAARCLFVCESETTEQLVKLHYYQDPLRPREVRKAEVIVELEQEREHRRVIETKFEKLRSAAEVFLKFTTIDGPLAKLRASDELRKLIEPEFDESILKNTIAKMHAEQAARIHQAETWEASAARLRVRADGLCLQEGGELAATMLIAEEEAALKRAAELREGQPRDPRDAEDVP